MKVVTLLSGGLDSTLMAYLFKEDNVEQYPLFINYGQLNFNKELESCKNVCNKLGITSLKILDVKGFGEIIGSGLTNKDLDINLDAFLPNRNALFLLLASSYAYKIKSKYIAIGLLNESDCIFPDQTRNFLDKMENLINISLGIQISILSPFIKISKGGIISLAKKRSISNTYSCHAGKDTPCGRCISCIEFINTKIK